MDDHRDAVTRDDNRARPVELVRFDRARNESDRVGVLARGANADIGVCRADRDGYIRTRLRVRVRKRLRDPVH